jgi:hypothetical protein
MFNYGDTALIRSLVNGRLWLMQSVTVVKDTPEETVLFLGCGAECVYPSGYWRWKRGDPSRGTRWDDEKSMTWTLRKFKWHTHRILMHMVPGQIYATYLMWYDETEEFRNYYINFQTPFQRTALGFNTHDLELDIVIDAEYKVHIKDVEGYTSGLREGCITEQQDQAIKSIKPAIFQMIQDRLYPLDGSWVDWRPDPGWESAKLPANWR